MDMEEVAEVADLIDNVAEVQQLANQIDEIVPPIPRRVFRDQLNPLEHYDERNFKANFAFSKDGFRHVLGIFGPQLEAKKRRDPPFSPLLMLSVFLLYLRSNGFYRSVATQFVVQLSKRAVGRIVNFTARVIANAMSAYVKFHTIDEQNEIAARFGEEYNFSGCIGIAGMYVRNFHSERDEKSKIPPFLIFFVKSICVLYKYLDSRFTVWKFQDFSVTQILRERKMYKV